MMVEKAPVAAKHGRADAPPPGRPKRAAAGTPPPRCPECGRALRGAAKWERVTDAAWPAPEKPEAEC